MAGPKFLSRQELYRLLQRESDPNVYADGAPSAFFTTASIDSKAGVLADVYSNMNRIYQNYWPQTADEKITDWEIQVFGKQGDATLTLDQRRAKIISKLRTRRSLDFFDLLTIIVGYLPEGVFAQIVDWGCEDGKGWQLGVSKLGIDTVLGWGMMSTLSNPNSLDLCELVRGDGWRLGSSHLGVDTAMGGTNDWQTISQVQAKAYTYEVRIFDYTLPAQDYANLVMDLAAAEPARSGRVILQNLQLADYGLVIPVANVDQSSDVNCIDRDSTSTTGYSGRIHG